MLWLNERFPWLETCGSTCLVQSHFLRMTKSGRRLRELMYYFSGQENENNQERVLLMRLFTLVRHRNFIQRIKKVNRC